jgi:lipoprotein signal peptidase
VGQAPPSFGVWFSITLGFVIVDQASKYLAARYLVIFENHAFAFSLPLPTPLMYGLYGLILGAVIVYIIHYYRRFANGEFLAWALIIGGGVSNIGERLVSGYVKDFIYLFNGVLNIADFYIISGIFILVLFSLQKNFYER